MIVDYLKTCEFNLPVDNMGDIPNNRNTPWQFSIETCTYTATTSLHFSNATTSTSTKTEIFFSETEISTTSDVVHIPYISSGETMIIYLMIVLIVLQLLYFLATSLSRIQTKKKYLQYNGGDVEQRTDL